MKLIRRHYFALLLLVCSGIRAHAQVEVLEKHVLEKIQNGNTHIVVTDLNFPQSGEFLQSFKKAWTVTKGVDYITFDNLIGNMVEGDSYFSIERYTYTSQYGSAFYVYLNLWQPKKKMLRDKKFKIGHENPLAHIQLSYTTSGFDKIFAENSGTGNLCVEGCFSHWNPGLLKNYLQLLCAELKTGKKTDYQHDMTDKTEIKDLSTKTLYYPEDNLNKMGLFVKADRTVNAKDIFDGYKYTYKVISDQELGEKIWADSEEFYYILFIRNAGSKLLLVVNSHTGKIVYSRFKSAMFGTKNANKSDMKDLYKVVKKN